MEIVVSKVEVAREKAPLSQEITQSLKHPFASEFQQRRNHRTRRGFSKQLTREIARIPKLWEGYILGRESANIQST